MEEYEIDFAAMMPDGLDFATSMLEKYGCLMPFGFTVLLNGSQEANAGHIAENEGEETPVALIELIIAGMVKNAKRNKIRSAMVVYEATITVPETGQESDAIATLMDNRHNHAIKIFHPFVRNNDKLTFSHSFTQISNVAIFPPAQNKRRNLFSSLIQQTGFRKPIN